MSGATAFMIIAFVYWLFLIGVGIYGFKTTKKSEDFFIAGGGLGFFVLSLSLLATYNSSIALMGHTGNVYGSGLSYLTYLGGAPIAISVLIPIFYKRVWLINRGNKYLTPAEMLGSYYKSDSIRGMIALIALMMGVPYVALQLIAAGTAFNILSQGIISVSAGMYVMGGIIVVYVVLGGLKSAAITNAIQGSLMTLALFLGAVYGLILVGGPMGLFNELGSLSKDMVMEGRVIPTSWQTNATLLLSIAVGTVIGPLSLTWALSAKSERIIHFSGIFSIVAQVVMYILLIPTIGFTAMVLHPSISVTDEVLPTLISTGPSLLYALVGLGIFAAINSTADAYLHASGAMTGHDLYRVITKSTVISPWVGRIAQLFVVFIGLIFIAGSSESIVFLGALAGGLGMQTIPALIGALFIPKYNKQGALWGMIVGVIVTIITEFIVKHPLGVHSGLWGVLFNFLVISVLSIVIKTPNYSRNYDHFHGTLKEYYKKSA
ncbi:sodium:solute symporter family protein [Virgibacillus sediminis]|uniref:Sodium:solute symporter n=1 Tax=Virgibacillus sediminis TaxID=202260 RepID=A0ABV7A5I4_9BACI